MNKNFKWWQYISLGSFVAGWFARSLKDNTVTRTEIEELIKGIMDMLELEEIKIDL